MSEEMPRHTTKKALPQPAVGVSAHHNQAGFLLGCGGNQGHAGGALVIRTGQRMRPNTVPGKIFRQIGSIDTLDVILGRGEDRHPSCQM